jgi:hypothetical protein
MGNEINSAGVIGNKIASISWYSAALPQAKG